MSPLDLGLGLLSPSEETQTFRRILAEGKDLIAGSSRTFTRASQRESVIRGGVMLAVNEIDDSQVELFPGVFAHDYAGFTSHSRVNDRSPSANTASGGTFTVDGVDPAKHTWSQPSPGTSVFFLHQLTISNNATYSYQLVVAKNSTGRIRFRVQDSANTDAASCDFDLVTGTFMNYLRQGAANHDFTMFSVTDRGTEWSIHCVWRAATADGTTGSNGRIGIYLTDDAGSITGAAIPSQVISAVQLTQNTPHRPYVPGAGKPVACSADNLILDQLPVQFAAAGGGEIWSFCAPWAWGFPNSQSFANQYIAGYAPFTTDVWMTFGLNITTQSGGQALGGGNCARGKGTSSTTAYSGTQGNYWTQFRRGYLGGSWDSQQLEVTYDELSVPGAAKTTTVSLLTASKPTIGFSRLTIGNNASAIAPCGRVCLWGWPRRLTRSERAILANAFTRTQYQWSQP